MTSSSGVGGAPVTGQEADERVTRRCEGCGNTVDQHGTTDYELHLSRQNRELRDELHAVQVRPLPDVDVPGYDIWRALMEDLRDEGLRRLSVRHQTVIEVAYEPIEAVVSGAHRV